jgi:hypothetical protein
MIENVLGAGEKLHRAPFYMRPGAIILDTDRCVRYFHLLNTEKKYFAIIGVNND